MWLKEVEDAKTQKHSSSPLVGNAVFKITSHNDLTVHLYDPLSSSLLVTDLHVDPK